LLCGTVSKISRQWYKAGREKRCNLLVSVYVITPLVAVKVLPVSLVVLPLQVAGCLGAGAVASVLVVDLATNVVVAVVVVIVSVVSVVSVVSRTGGSGGDGEGEKEGEKGG
jgi:hypothetical protein